MLDPGAGVSNAFSVTADDGYLLRLRSDSELERDGALADLRRLLRGALARSFGGKFSEGDLDDLAQDSLLRVHSQLHTFERQSRFTTWATAIAVNCALSELRRRRYRHVTLEDAAAQGHAALTADSQVPAGETELALANLQRGIAEALTDRQREAMLALLGGLPLMEIARRLETTQGAIYKLLHDARKRLKAYLETGGDRTSLLLSAGQP